MTGRRQGANGRASRHLEGGGRAIERSVPRKVAKMVGPICAHDAARAHRRRCERDVTATSRARDRRNTPLDQGRGARASDVCLARARHASPPE